MNFIKFDFLNYFRFFNDERNERQWYEKNDLIIYNTTNLINFYISFLYLLTIAPLQIVYTEKMLNEYDFDLPHLIIIQSIL